MIANRIAGHEVSLKYNFQEKAKNEGKKE